MLNPPAKCYDEMDVEAAATGGAARCSVKEVKTVAGILTLGTVFLVLLFLSIHPSAAQSLTDRPKLICAVVVLGLIFVGSLAAYIVCYRLRPHNQVHPVMPNIIVAHN